jgi:hypothetical protein
MPCSLKNNTIAGLTVLALFACNGPDKDTIRQPLKVMLSADSSAMLLAGLDHDLVLSVSGDSSANDVWQSLFPVYNETSDPEMIGLEPAYPGKYLARADTLIFVPDSGFTSGHTYRAEISMPGYFSQQDAARNDKLPGSRKTSEFRFVFK